MVSGPLSNIFLKRGTYQANCLVMGSLEPFSVFFSKKGYLSRQLPGYGALTTLQNLSRRGHLSSLLSRYKIFGPLFSVFLKNGTYQAICLVTGSLEPFSFFLRGTYQANCQVTGSLEPFSKFSTKEYLSRQLPCYGVSLAPFEEFF